MKKATAMKTHSDDTELRQHALAIGIWENEGGAPAPDTLDHQYGRRIEMDRSGIVYHVFTGVQHVSAAMS
jgi:hypothetical protein